MLNVLLEACALGHMQLQSLGRTVLFSGFTVLVHRLSAEYDSAPKA